MPKFLTLFTDTDFEPVIVNTDEIAYVKQSSDFSDAIVIVMKSGERFDTDAMDIGDINSELSK